MAMRIVIAVTNDLVTDQRVFRISQTLLEQGYKITLVGRKLKHSKSVNYNTEVKRFRLFFNKGAKFYANYNIRLFCYLLFKRFDVILSNDLDSLPASYFAAKLRSKKIVYDSHEYFTEVPELVERKLQQNIWLWFEKKILPKLKHTYTVCESIALKYNELYGCDFKVIRNVPFKRVIKQTKMEHTSKVLIYQGALNLGRGIELMIETVKHLSNAELWIAGTGDIEQELKQLAIDLGLKEKVNFLGRIPINELHEITSKADLGLSLEENLGLNYYFALPNKLFDYIQAEIPFIVADLPEMSSIVEQYNIGEVLRDRKPEILAKQIESLLSKTKNESISENLSKAANILNWENEKSILIDMFREVENELEKPK